MIEYIIRENLSGLSVSVKDYRKNFIKDFMVHFECGLFKILHGKTKRRIGMTDLIVIGIVAVLLIAAIAYIVKAKKSGVKCIGCPDGGTCSGNCGGGASCSGCQSHK